MLHPVATQTLIPVEEYLRTVYEPDAEFVDGEIVERNPGENPHNPVQARLVEIFYELKKKHPAHCRTELRMWVATARIRIPDVALFHPEKPAELVPSDAPLVVVEIVSREDRHTEIIQKFEEHRAWGVPHIWLADPWQR
jgi:Uma2 family endonuclease